MIIKTAIISTFVSIASAGSATRLLSVQDLLVVDPGFFLG